VLELTIRRATPSDAQAIAELHVRAWQWAYAGLLPDDLLQGLADTLDRRIEARRTDLANEPPEQRTWIVEQAGNPVGFAITGPTRDEDAVPKTGEVGAIYLRPDVVGRGIGRALFAHAVEDLRQRGYAQATLWVLDTNVRGRGFYEAAGWTADGASKTEQRAGALLREVRYRVSLA
jgi:ribosomal protein S18 acetylase RimI-like enzyme